MALFEIIKCERCGEEYMEQSGSRIKVCPNCVDSTVDPEIPLDFWTEA